AVHDMTPWPSSLAVTCSCGGCCGPIGTAGYGRGEAAPRPNSSANASEKAAAILTSPAALGWVPSHKSLSGSMSALLSATAMGDVLVDIEEATSEIREL